MNEIFAARKALLAYLIISAVRRSVMTIGARNGKCNCATLFAASLSREPITLRCGLIKSAMAEPSRRNSGQDTTAKSIGLGCAPFTISATQSPVPIGTVDLLIMISGAVMFWAMDFAADSTYFRSAFPSTPDGVPTAINANSAPLSACS